MPEDRLIGQEEGKFQFTPPGLRLGLIMAGSSILTTVSLGIGVWMENNPEETRRLIEKGVEVVRALITP